MNRRLAGALIAASGLVFGAAVVFLVSDRSPPAPAAELPSAQPETAAAEETAEVTLYFPGRGGYLYAESRQVVFSGELSDRVETILAELLAGPTSEGLEAALPPGTRLRGIDLTDDGRLYVDLETGPEGPPSFGSRRERLVVYSLVDSLLLNLEDLRRVGFLWNGVQSTTFGGHIDITRPLTADLSLVASRP